LAAAEEALAAEKVAHGSAVTSLKADLDVAQQEASSLQNQLKALESQLAAGKQAFEAVIQNVASFSIPLKAAQQQAAAEKQAQEAAVVCPLISDPCAGRTADCLDPSHTARGSAAGAGREDRQRDCQQDNQRPPG